MGNKKNELFAVAAVLVGSMAAGKKAYDKHNEKKAAEAQRVAELERQQSKQSVGLLGKIMDGIGNFANTANETYTQAYTFLQNESDKRLMEYSRHLSGAEALGRAKAAHEILKERGYHLMENGEWRR